MPNVWIQNFNILPWFSLKRGQVFSDFQFWGRIQLILHWFGGVEQHELLIRSSYWFLFFKERTNRTSLIFWFNLIADYWFLNQFFVKNYRLPLRRLASLNLRIVINVFVFHFRGVNLRIFPFKNRFLRNSFIWKSSIRFQSTLCNNLITFQLS